MDSQKQECYLDIKHIPLSSDRQAVVIATIHDNTGIWQGIGASWDTNLANPYNPQALIDEASKQAQQRAMSHSAGAMKSEKVEAKPKLMDSIPHSDKTEPKSARPHKTAPGTITDKQFKTLTKMSLERKTTLDDLAQEHFGLPPRDMSSEQAQDLFDYFKSQGR